MACTRSLGYSWNSANHQSCKTNFQIICLPGGTDAIKCPTLLFLIRGQHRWRCRSLNSCARTSNVKAFVVLQVHPFGTVQQFTVMAPLPVSLRFVYWTDQSPAPVRCAETSRVTLEPSSHITSRTDCPANAASKSRLSHKTMLLPPRQLQAMPPQPDTTN